MILDIFILCGLDIYIVQLLALEKMFRYRLDLDLLFLSFIGGCCVDLPSLIGKFSVSICIYNYCGHSQLFIL